VQRRIYATPVVKGLIEGIRVCGLVNKSYMCSLKTSNCRFVKLQLPVYRRNRQLFSKTTRAIVVVIEFISIST